MKLEYGFLEIISKTDLYKVIVFDQLIDKAESKDNAEYARDLFNRQLNILYRLEKVIS